MVRRIHPGWQLPWKPNEKFGGFDQEVPEGGKPANGQRTSGESRRMLPCGKQNHRRRIPSEAMDATQKPLAATFELQPAGIGADYRRFNAGPFDSVSGLRSDAAHEG